MKCRKIRARTFQTLSQDERLLILTFLNRDDQNWWAATCHKYRSWNRRHFYRQAFQYISPFSAYTPERQAWLGLQLEDRAIAIVVQGSLADVTQFQPRKVLLRFTGFAARFGRREILALLLQWNQKWQIDLSTLYYREDENAEDLDPLIQAVKGKNLPCLRYLAEHWLGYAHSLNDYEGIYAMELALQSGFKEGALFLKESGYQKCISYKHALLGGMTMVRLVESWGYPFNLSCCHEFLLSYKFPLEVLEYCYQQKSQLFTAQTWWFALHSYHQPQMKVQFLLDHQIPFDLQIYHQQNQNNCRSLSKAMTTWAEQYCPGFSCCS